MTLLMLIMIVLGIGVAAAALVYVAVVAYRLYKLVREAQHTVVEPIQEILAKQQLALQKLDRLQRRQASIQQHAEALAESARTLAYLKTQLSDGINSLVGRS